MEITVSDAHDDDELGLLARQAQRGNAAAFDALAQRVRDRIRRWAHRVVGDGDEAEDIAQIVLVRLHSHLAEFEGRSRLASWLYRVTRNAALERRRGEAQRSALLARAVRIGAEVPGVGADAPPIDDTTDRAVLHRIVETCLADLSPRQREVFELIELRGLAIGAVADRLGIETSTVRVLLLRARRGVRTRMLERHSRLLEEHRP